MRAIPQRSTIAGAGSSGVLLAHYLLHRSDKYQIDIYERLSDPRIVSFSKSRTYPITLNERRMNALSHQMAVIGLRLLKRKFKQLPTNRLK